jgi:voltage-gated potassium channel
MSPGNVALADLAPLIPAALALFSDNDFTAVKRGLRVWAQNDPLDAVFALVVGGGIAFYAAEKDTNPGCRSPWDGILYMATSLSVGYDNLFPTTTAGHALATFAQTVGPSLAANVFEPPAAEARAAEQAQANVQLAILERLDRIVQLLEKQS